MGKASNAKNERRWSQFLRAVPTLNGRPLPPEVGMTMWKNNLYTVTVKDDIVPPWGVVRWLSIKRNDRRPIHDWRDLQAIKNELCGKEIEAVEIYPASARVMDTANQYHLWAFMDGRRLPFGIHDERLVLDDGETPPEDRLGSPAQAVAFANATSNAKQRPFAPGRRP